jgi:hypothetical protein
MLGCDPIRLFRAHARPWKHLVDREPDSTGNPHLDGPDDLRVAIRSVRVDMSRPQFNSLVTAIKHAADVSSQWPSHQ